MAKKKGKLTKSQEKKLNRFFIKNPKILIAVVVIAIVAFIVYCYLNPEFYNSLFGKTDLSYSNHSSVELNQLNDLEVHIIDVGQGDAILIKMPSGKNVLIDSGDTDKEVKEKLQSYFNDKNIKTIDYLIATHPDADHIGSMDRVFEITKVKKVFRPYVKYVSTSNNKYNFTSDFNQGISTHSTATYANFLNMFKDVSDWEFFTKDSDIISDVIFNDKTYSCILDFLSPLSLTSLSYKNINDFSPYIMLTYGNFKMLFTGDAEKNAEKEFINEYKNNQSYVDCDILKVAHHGSGTSSTDNFLSLVKPETAVISCGVGNKYNHPHREALNNLVESNSSINVYRTDTNGDIVITIKYNELEDDIKVSLANQDLTKNFISPEDAVNENN